MKLVPLRFNGKTIKVDEGVTVLEAARRAGTEVPNVCASDRVGYGSRSSCRLCLVEVVGEHDLVAACTRRVERGMAITTRSARIDQVRRLVAELTLSELTLPGHRSLEGTPFGQLMDRLDVTETRFGFRTIESSPDTSHPAVHFMDDACIRCGLCRSACREAQMNDIILMAGIGSEVHIEFESKKSLADTACTSCGECVQVCPTAALNSYSKTHSHDVRVKRQASTICPYCSVGCRMELQITDNKVVTVNGADGPSNRGRLCVKGRYGLDFLHHPERLTVPLVRKEGAPKDAERQMTSAEILELFREASWEEALALAVAGFSEIKDKFGGNHLAVLGSAKNSSEDAYVLQKLARTAFGSPHVDHCTRLCASVPPLAEAIGYSAVTAPIEQVFSSDVILMVGSNPEVNHPVAATFMKNAVRNGTKLILIDPYDQPFARDATYHLQLRPGTDVALLSAMTHVIIAEGLFDQSFIENRLNGYEELAERVAGVSPHTASRICGVPETLISDAARLFAKAPAAISFWGMGASQHVHGADNIRAVIALALICGQIGRPGAGLHPLRGQNNVQGTCDAGLIPSSLPGYRNVLDEEERRFFERAWNSELPIGTGLTVVEILDAAIDGNVKGIYVVGGNPAMANPDLSRTRRALASIEHLVVQDIFPTATCAFADVILPAAALPEREGTVTNTDRFVQLLEKSLDAPGNARPDWEITTAIASRMGLHWNYRNVRDIFEEMARLVPSLNGMSWDLIAKDRSIRYPLDHSSFSNESLFSSAFPTKDGRAHLAKLNGRGPGELPDDDYPFVLITGRVREHWHTGSMTRRSATLDTLSNEPIVYMAPADLSVLGLEEMDWVSVRTRRGRLKLRVASDDRLQEGVIWMSMSFFEAAANELTPSSLDDTTHVPEYKYCAANLESYKNIN